VLRGENALDRTPTAGTSASSGPKLGIAFGGGAELGLAHIGILRVLETQGLAPCLVAGSSAGALVGAFYAAGASVNMMERVSLRLNWRSIQRMILPVLALSSNEPLRRFLGKTLPAESFDTLKLPLRLVATDLLTAEMVVFEGGPGFQSKGQIGDEDVVFTTGDLLDAIRASCTRPVINRPVDIDGRLLVDGCLTNNIPSFLVRDMGADVVIGIDLMTRRRRNRRPTNILAYALQTQAIHMHWALKNRRVAADVVIRPDFRFLDEADGFSRRNEVIAAGERAAEAAASAIRRALEHARARGEEVT
jgi:NTE family protein